MKSLLLLFRVLSVLCLSAGLCCPLAAQNGTVSAPTNSSAGLSGSGEASPPASSDVVIPGPLRSFFRMAGISQKISPEEVLPLLSRNVFAQGYEGSQTKGRQTEFLILLMRYVEQARELATLAGPEGVIRISGCEDARPLLHILGYRVRQECGRTSTSLVTSDPDRAFLTVDSGFPLPELEETLAGGGPFSYPFHSSRVQVLFSDEEWVRASREAAKDDKDLLDALLRDPVLAHLYWAITRMDRQTGAVLRQSPGLEKLLPYAAVLDFYGDEIRVRGDHVLVPGGSEAQSSWKDLVGASPATPGEFVLHLVAKDRAWLAAYFDALSRVNQTQQAHLTEPRRLRRLYQALREPDPSVDAARPVFRPAPSLLMLFTRLQWDADGKPHVPGNLDVWKQILNQKTDSKVIREWAKRANRWNDPEQLLEGMVALSRVETDTGPLQIYLMLSELDGRRAPGQRLSPPTARLMASKFAQYSNQYLIFSEFPELNDQSIARFVNAADQLDKISNHTLRGNAMGIFQANIGLWQILARQGQIPRAKLNDSWQRAIQPLADIHSAPQLFDGGWDSLREVLVAAAGSAKPSQDDIIELLAGPRQSTPEGQQMHEELATRMRTALEEQRLVSLDTIQTLGDGLKEMAQGKAEGKTYLPQARELEEFEMPRPIFTNAERTEWAAGIYNNRHTELEMRTDLTKLIKSQASPEQLEQARGQLAPFFRDTLVGLNYAYYEPPGAQVLHHNPLFVRSHDFSGDTVAGVERVWQAPLLFGEGSPAGGGAHLVGSLADLPYVLANAEQDFITPENVQALIWRELVPGLLVNSILPRWWDVSRDELHAIALYQRAGEDLLRASEQQPEMRSQIRDMLSDRMTPQFLERLEEALRAGRLAEVSVEISPADTFYLAAEFRRRYPGKIASVGPAGQELEALCQSHPQEVSWQRLSEDFGVPHPILAQTYARELLNVRPFPAFEGYSSRLLAETWDSNNLYWARLLDESGYSPVMLNRFAPELTRRMVEKIFATDFEDWPAILRALRETGEEFRQGKIALLPKGGL
ncbi:MAG TPA: hypothetical protein VEK33_07890 [Terriglobales bacterium]|nr:hypothetical protein [Terriglobales bacterium]